MTRHELNEVFARTSFLDGANATYLAELYARYETDPASLDPEWRSFFASLGDDATAVLADAAGPSWAPQAPARPASAKAGALTQQQAIDAARDTLGARMLIRAYRTRGHLIAQLDPLRLNPRGDHPELNPATYGFTPADYARPIYIGGALGFVDAVVAKVDIGPAGEDRVAVPDALAVSQEYKSRHWQSPSELHALVYGAQRGRASPSTMPALIGLGRHLPVIRD